MKNRVKELRSVRAGDLKPDLRNWRLHPKEQRDALVRMLDDVGWADAIKAREDNGDLYIVDGHLRAGLDPEELIPVLLLDIDRDEAAKVIATHDPLAAMAERDDEALNWDELQLRKEEQQWALEVERHW